MPDIIEGELSAKELRFAIIVGRFNSFIGERLLAGALDALTRTGCPEENIEIVRVPGSWEMPVIACELAKAKRHDAIIALGAVIRGDTPHFDYISAEVSRGIGQAALDADVPIIFGVLTTHTIAQAIERSDPTKFNRGGEAAVSAIEMATVMRVLEKSEDTPLSVELPKVRRAKKRTPRKRVRLS
jgi:6,7-dimethyl-8-ribityllumazine synthase